MGANYISQNFCIRQLADTTQTQSTSSASTSLFHKQKKRKRDTDTPSSSSIAPFTEPDKKICIETTLIKPDLISYTITASRSCTNQEIITALTEYLNQQATIHPSTIRTGKDN